MFPKCANGFVYIYSCCTAKGSLLRIHISSQLPNFTHNKTKEIITANCIYSIFLWPTLVPCVDFSAHLLSHVVFSNPLPTLVMFSFYCPPMSLAYVCMYAHRLYLVCTFILSFPRPTHCPWCVYSTLSHPLPTLCPLQIHV